MMMAACGNKQKAAEATEADSTETFEEQQIKAGMNVQLDSLTNLWLGMKRRGVFGVDKEGSVVLSEAEKKVAPDYLFTPDGLKDKMETLSAKYRALTVFYVDKQIGDAYGMTDVWTPAMKKLMSEINDPALEELAKAPAEYNKEYEALNQKIYKMMEEEGRANFFWETAATSIVEQTYLISVNQEKLLAKLTDKDAEDLTYRIALLMDAYEELSQYNPQLMQLLTVLQPLEKLNAISVSQLRDQLNESKDAIANSRKMLFDF